MLSIVLLKKLRGTSDVSRTWSSSGC
uniref:Uncharacterized protein n=1 Tax=Arundo donax TaxID=35708 RepID=A0A0A9BUN5_ARUDO